MYIKLLLLDIPVNSAL